MSSLEQRILFDARRSSGSKYEDQNFDSGYLRSGKILFRMKEILEFVEHHIESIKRFDNPEAVYARNAHNPREHLATDLTKIQIELEHLMQPERIIRPKFRESLKKFRDQFIATLEKVNESKISESTRKQISAITQSLNSLLLHGIKLRYKSILQHPDIQELTANLEEVKKLHEGGNLLASRKKLTELGRASTLLANRAHKASNSEKRVLKQKLLEAESSFRKLIQVTGLEKAIQKIWSNLRAAVSWSGDVSASKYTDHSKPIRRTFSPQEVQESKPVKHLDRAVNKHVSRKSLNYLDNALRNFVRFFTKIPKGFLGFANTKLDLAEDTFIEKNSGSNRNALYMALNKFDQARTQLAA